MRNTLNIDDDILGADKYLVGERGVSIGVVISELVRRGLDIEAPVEWKSGFPLLPKRPGGPPITLELVNSLRDDDSWE
jgi:hypothetical protein